MAKGEYTVQLRVRYGETDQMGTFSHVRALDWFECGRTELLRGIGTPYAEMERRGSLPQLYQQIQATADEAEHRRLFRQILELNRQNLWVIGTVGQIPTVFLVHRSFRNVPRVALAGWVFRTPGNTAPECYAIQED